MMTFFLPGSLEILALALVALVGVFALVLSVRLLRLLLRLLGRILRFIRGQIQDCVRLAAALCAACILLPLFLLRTLAGSTSAARHYARALENELVVAGRCLSRILLLHPARLLGLAGAGGAGQRVARAMEREPGPEPEDAGLAGLEGFVLEGTLPGGGSGARLYVARPGRERVDAWRRAGLPVPERVVIKLFLLDEGSNLPQIVRESRALEAARDLGLVLEHGIDENRFYYVMPYVPGVDLGTVTEQLHAATGHQGLDDRRLREVLGYVADLLATLDRYHRHGLWHKDVKPENVIISAGRAYLVDLGLVTPLRSGMTLTTHGTEYYRDPELVRSALRGAKVSEVDGVRFDLYGVGAVLFSLVDGTFPAHGSLSQVQRRCPEALRWVIRRAMADLQQRYGSAREMLADIEALRSAADPFAVRPADLPSVHGELAADVAPPPAPPAPEPWPGARPGLPLPPPVPPSVPPAAPVEGRRRFPVAAVLLLLVIATVGMALVLLVTAVDSQRTVTAGPVSGAQVFQDDSGAGVFLAAAEPVPALPLVVSSTRWLDAGEVPPRQSPRTLLLVEDLSAAGPEERQLVQALCDRLAALGFIVLGDPRQELGPETLALLAAARRDFMARDLGDEEAEERLIQAFWVDHRLRALLRLRPGRQGGGWSSSLLALPGAGTAGVESLLQGGLRSAHEAAPGR